MDTAGNASSLPKRLAIHESGHYLDGGTIVLKATDDEGLSHEVVLGQHMLPQVQQDWWIPGRLYLDHKLVPIRSEMEAALLELLRAAEIGPNLPDDPQERRGIPPNTLVLGDDIREVMTRGPKENLRALTANVIRFVESDEYVFFTERVVVLSWEDLGLPGSIVDRLQSVGIRQPGLILMVTEEDLLAAGRLDRDSVAEIRRCLERHGLLERSLLRKPGAEER